MKFPKKRKWPFYLMIFAMTSVADFVVSMVIDQYSLRYAAIQAIIFGVIFTGFWWLIEKPQKDDQK